MTELASRQYVRFSDQLEKIPPNEEKDIQAVADIINAQQRERFNLHRHCYGGTHIRTQGLVKGTFIVSDDLPSYLKQGELFAKGGSYPAAARYSTETPDPGIDDRIPQPRGFALKIFDVDGDFYEAGAGIPTQDIEFNSTPAIELADAKTTREILELRHKFGNDKPTLCKHIEARPDAELQKARDQVPNLHLESTGQYSQSAYRFGDYVMKYRLVPSSEAQKQLAAEHVKDSDTNDVLSNWLQRFHREHEAEYLFQVQLLENVEEQPIEYAGAEWDADKYPFQTVATLRFPRQDSFDYKRKAFWEDHVRVDPWLGLKSYQPLGSTNRLRRVVYPASSRLRREMNGRDEIHVKSIDEIP